MTTSPVWMPFYVADYLKDTNHLRVEEHGAYFLLIMRYWQDRGLPADEGLIARYSLLTAEQWAASRNVLAALFDEGWKHKRIDEELAKADDIVAKRRKAAEQRYTSSAHAEQMQSTSTYAGVPPSPSPLVIEPPASVPKLGAREAFDELWEVFPRNPLSSESKARLAFDPAKAPAILVAAHRYRRWFTEDNETRQRTEDAGARFAPLLSKWLTDEAWKDAAKLRLKAEANQPSPDLVVLRDGDPLIPVIEAKRGKKFIIGQSGAVTVPKADVDAARAQAAA